MEKIWKSSTNVFLLQIIASGLVYGVTKNPAWVFVASTIPVFVAGFEESVECYGVIGFLSVLVAYVFSGDDLSFFVMVSAMAMVLVAIVVAGIEASDAKLHREARESMWALFLAGLPYGIGMVFGAIRPSSYRRESK